MRTDGKVSKRAVTSDTAVNAASGRTYGQYCPIAKGLDVIGDRWVLLICRELSFGDQRFTDLRVALPRIAPNLLSDRLRDLQAAGLVTTAELPPPAARTVYRLTPEGRRIVPVLRAVARFGATYLDGEPSADFDARRAASALLLPWWRAERAEGTPERLRLDVGDDRPVDLVRTGRTLRVEPADEVGADAVLHTTIDALAEARRTSGPLAAEVLGASSEALARAFDLDLLPATA
jgi:DNA-binding HxlR family transcriptional regulator